jgi:glycosyltransferase involved in cell wall biosynthesis
LHWPWALAQAIRFNRKARAVTGDATSPRTVLSIHGPEDPENCDFNSFTARIVGECGFDNQVFTIPARPPAKNRSSSVSDWFWNYAWFWFVCIPNVPLIFIKIVLRYRVTLIQLREVIRRRGIPDVCVALSSCSDSGFIAFICHRLWGVPYAVLEHDSGYRRGSFGYAGRILRRITLGSAALPLAVSSELAAAIRAALDRPGLRIGIMPNPVTARFLIPMQWSARDGRLNANIFTFGASTRWRRLKRLDVLLEAFELLCSRGINANLHIAGPPENKSREACGKMRYADRIKYYGTISRDKIVEFFDDCDCWVVPSDYETFGVPVIEAMARGLPVIATRCGGPETIITSTDLGRIVEAGDAVAMSRAMEEVVLNYRHFDPERIRAHIEKRYSPSYLRERWREALLFIAATSARDQESRWPAPPISEASPIVSPRQGRTSLAGPGRDRTRLKVNHRRIATTRRVPKRMEIDEQRIQHRAEGPIR